MPGIVDTIKNVFVAKGPKIVPRGQLKAPNGVWYPSLNTTDQANVLSIDVALATPIRLSLSGATTADLDYVLETDLNYVATMPDAS